MGRSGLEYVYFENLIGGDATPLYHRETTGPMRWTRTVCGRLSRFQQGASRMRVDLAEKIGEPCEGCFGEDSRA